MSDRQKKRVVPSKRRKPHAHPKKNRRNNASRVTSLQGEELDWRERILTQLSPKLGYPIACDGINEQHLFEAFTHRTYAHERAQAEIHSSVEDNQRLEFLGDSILGYITTIKLYARFSTLTEGELSALRASLINRDTLKNVAIETGLEPYLRLGRGEPNMGEAARDARLADLTESVIGAMYLDLGLEATSQWVWKQLEPHLKSQSTLFMYETQTLDLEQKDPKTALQHWAHKLYKSTPSYDTHAIHGSNQTSYRSKVCLDGEVIGEGQGITKKQAERAAALNALDARQHLT